jgi:amino acid transporter
MIIMQVVAPVPIFGLLEERSNGHAIATVLIAMLPMIITAVSYGRMAALYPMAGSAYTYVSRALNPHLGFVIGWSMLLDYLMIPLISAIIPALAIQRVWPALPFPLLTLLIILLMTMLNLRGIRATTRANTILLWGTSATVLIFLLLAIRYCFLKGGWSGVVSWAPVYDPATFKVSTVMSGISLAALTYVGFDGLTTLAEDAVNPRRDMVLATSLVVVITGLLSGVELYFLHLVMPDWRAADPNTSYLDVMRMVGGVPLFVALLIVISLSQFGAGFSVQVNAARLLYGMGRDRVLPRGIFGYLSPGNQNPSRNIVVVGALAFLGTVIIPFDHALDLLNFGAFLGYMGVNAATVWGYWFHPPAEHRRSMLWDCVVPTCGFAGSLIFWLGLPHRAQLVGTLWLLAGVIFCASRTRGFRERPLLFDFSGT